MANKKKTAANLEFIAKSMPDIFRKTIEYHMVKGSELIAQGHTEEDGVPIIPDMEYKQDMPVMIALNHTNNLKKWFASHGRIGIEIYCTNVKRWHLKQEAEKAGTEIKEEIKFDHQSAIVKKLNAWWDKLVN